MQKRRNDGHTLSVANRFKHFLREQGEDSIADEINGRMWRPSIGSPAGTAERVRKLKAEFDAKRRQTLEANKRIKDTAAAMRAIPEDERKKRASPRRFVAKGIAG